MKKKILTRLYNKIKNPDINKAKYLWLRFWIEKFQDKEFEYESLSKMMNYICRLKDVYILNQIYNNISDCFVINDILVLVVLNRGDQFNETIQQIHFHTGINISIISDKWSGQYQIYNQRALNSLL